MTPREQDQQAALQAALEDLERVKQERLPAAVERDRDKGAASYVFSTRRRLRLLYEVVTGQPMRVCLSDAEAVDEFDEAVRRLKFDFTVMQDAREELARVKQERDGLAVALTKAYADLDGIERGRGGCEQQYCADAALRNRAQREDISAILSTHDRKVAARVLREIVKDGWKGDRYMCYLRDIADAYERGEREVPTCG